MRTGEIGWTFLDVRHDVCDLKTPWSEYQRLNKGFNNGTITVFPMKGYNHGKENHKHRLHAPNR